MKKAVFSVAITLGIWLISSCGGNSSTPSATGGSVAKAISGEDVYKRTCIACHQPNGAGLANTFPPLAKSDFIADREKTISQVIKGKSGALTVNGVTYNNMMPPQSLNDDEIAAVLTYVYTSFGNAGAPVTVDEVKAVRAKAQ